MRSAGNFNPEWGYLAPAPSFMRTARVVLVATAIGATAGAAVVISLIDRPAPEGDRTASVAAHAIVTAVHAAPATMSSAAAPPAAAAAPIKVTNAAAPAPAAVAKTQPRPQPQAPLAVPPAVAAPQIAVQPAPVGAAPMQSAAVASQPTVTTPARDTIGTSDAAAAPARKLAPGLASLSEASPAIETAPADTAEQGMIPPQTVPPEKKSKHHAVASNAKSTPGLGTVLRHLFNPHTGPSYYPNR
jgi:ribonuclease E